MNIKFGYPERSVWSRWSSCSDICYDFLFCVRVVILTEEIDELRKEHLEACQQKKETTERLKKFETDLDEARYELTHKDDQIAR